MALLMWHCPSGITQVALLNTAGSYAKEALDAPSGIDCPSGIAQVALVITAGSYAKNKAVYTTAPIAGGWAGAVMIWAGA